MLFHNLNFPVKKRFKIFYGPHQSLTHIWKNHKLLCHWKLLYEIWQAWRTNTRKPCKSIWIWLGLATLSSRPTTLLTMFGGLLIGGAGRCEWAGAKAGSCHRSTNLALQHPAAMIHIQTKRERETERVVEKSRFWQKHEITGCPMRSFCPWHFAGNMFHDALCDVNVRQQKSTKLGTSKNITFYMKITNRIVTRYSFCSIGTFWYTSNHFFLTFHFQFAIFLVYFWYS